MLSYATESGDERKRNNAEKGRNSKEIRRKVRTESNSKVHEMTKDSSKWWENEQQYDLQKEKEHSYKGLGMNSQIVNKKGMSHLSNERKSEKRSNELELSPRVESNNTSSQQQSITTNEGKNANKIKGGSGEESSECTRSINSERACESSDQSRYQEDEEAQNQDSSVVSERGSQSSKWSYNKANVTGKKLQNGSCTKLNGGTNNEDTQRNTTEKKPNYVEDCTIRNCTI